MNQTSLAPSSLQLNYFGLSPEADQYLTTLRRKYTALEVLCRLEQARALKVLVLGDAILDEYRYCDTLGKSGKEPMLAWQFVRADEFIGGTHAVAEHVRACADDVQCVTGPSVIKRRFVERYPFQKLGEEYVMDEAAAEAEAARLLPSLLPKAKASDLVIVADYGHGFLTAPLVNLLTLHAKFLAVNVQANAGNHGFNTITKYPRADFISLSERELRLDARDLRSGLDALMTKASAARSATLMITRGAHGCRAVSPTEGFADAPALATHTVDRMGAGDAVFGVTSCCAAVGMPVELLSFMASAVGTQAVGIIGNARYIERQALRTYVEMLLA